MLKTSVVVVRAGLWRGHDGSRETSQEVTAGIHDPGMARMITMGWRR